MANKSDQEFFAERGFGQRIGFGLHPALIVIDLLKGFTDPNMPLGANFDKEMVETKRVLASAREADIPIFYTAVAYEEQDLKDAGVWARKARPRSWPAPRRWSSTRAWSDATAKP
jgi:maleamate amidohydrolase